MNNKQYVNKWNVILIVESGNSKIINCERNQFGWTKTNDPNPNLIKAKLPIERRFCESDRVRWKWELVRQWEWEINDIYIYRERERGRDREIL